MKLTLKNFRCYTEKVFDFGESGMLLLAGPSGSGKSTLLYAIMFVLYDRGNKLVTYGKKSCSVCLEIEGMKITRTKGPCRLVLETENGVYEDDMAQGIIDSRFGKCFETTSYVQQNAYDAFITMKPVEKLAFLEKFTCPFGEVKNKCKAMIKARNDELTSIVSQLSMAKTQLDSLIKPEKVNFPVKTLDKEKTEKTFELRVKRCLKNIGVFEADVESGLKMLNECSLYENNKKHYTDQKTELDSSLTSIQSEIKALEYLGDVEYEKLKSRLAALLENKKYFNQKEEYEKALINFENLRRKEIENAEVKLNEYKEILWNEVSKADIDSEIQNAKLSIKYKAELDCARNVVDTAEYKSSDVSELQKSVNDSKSRVEELKNVLSKLKLQSALYKCPSCKIGLKLTDSGLCIENTPIHNVSESEVKHDLEVEQKKLAGFEAKLYKAKNEYAKYKQALEKIQEISELYDFESNTMSDLEETLDSLVAYKQENIQIEKAYVKLEKRGLSDSLLTIEKQLKSMKEVLNMYELTQALHNLSLNENENDIRTELEKETKKRTVLSGLKKQEKVLLDKLTEVENKLENLAVFTMSIVEIESKIEDDKGKLRMEKEKHVEAEKVLNGIAKYKVYKKEKEVYDKWVNQVESLENDEKIAMAKYTASKLYLDKIAKAESIVLSNTIEKINMHAQDYLDLFFPENPIVVRLEPFKQSKKGGETPQINLVIDYKGMECELNMLSGGETSRVVLAFTLALAEMFNSPFILLDECTASLDSEMTSVVIEGIRKTFGDKLVITIAHQVIFGEFDRTIEL